MINYTHIPDDLVINNVNKKGNIIYLDDEVYKISRFDVKSNCYIAVLIPGGLKHEEAAESETVRA